MFVGLFWSTAGIAGTSAVSRALIETPLERLRGATVYLSRLPSPMTAKLFPQSGVSKVMICPRACEQPSYITATDSLQCFSHSSIAVHFFVPDPPTNYIEDQAAFVSRQSSLVSVPSSPLANDWNPLSSPASSSSSTLTRSAISSLTSSPMVKDTLFNKNFVGTPIHLSFYEYARNVGYLTDIQRSDSSPCFLPSDINPKLKEDEKNLNATHHASATRRLTASIAFLQRVFGEALKWIPAGGAQDIHRSWFLTIAALVQMRTDDPDDRSVGVVVYNRTTLQLCGLGWNGYQIGATDLDYCPSRKHDVILHAEQNMLLFHRFQNPSELVLISTREPCHECAPLCARQKFGEVMWLYRESKTTNDEAKLVYIASHIFAQAGTSQSVLHFNANGPPVMSASNAGLFEDPNGMSVPTLKRQAK